MIVYRHVTFNSNGTFHDWKRHEIDSNALDKEFLQEIRDRFAKNVNSCPTDLYESRT